MRRLTVTEISDLQEVRLALETSAALRVAREQKPDTARRLARRLEQLRAAEHVPFPERLKADLAFHHAVVTASGNATLDDLWRGLVGRITVMLLSVGEEGVGHLQAADAHQPLLEAIESRDEARIRETYQDVFDYGTRVVVDAVRAAAVDEMSDGELTPRWEGIA